MATSPRLTKVPGSAAPVPSTERSFTSPERAVLALRLGIGVVWTLNLIFIFDPKYAFFGSFTATAGSYAPVSLVGSAFPDFVAAHPLVFSLLIAGVTLYLAIAFLLGLTTRLACLVGAGFAVALLVSQFGGIFNIPGGTDVGPMPIYLTVYIALAVGHAERYLSLDAVAARRGYPWSMGFLARSIRPS